MKKIWKIVLNKQKYIQFILLYYSGFLYNIQYLKIPSVSILEMEELNKNPRKIRYRPILKVEVIFNNYEIEHNYRKIVSIEQSKIETDVNYFRKYLFHLYGCEKTREEIQYILININFIKKYVLKKLELLDASVRKKVVDMIVLDNHFYKRTSRDLTVKLYRFLYDNKPSILKCYFFFPDFAYYTSMMETRFENEIIFQEYAAELNEKHNFITPKIYDYGTCLIKLRENSEEKSEEKIKNGYKVFLWNKLFEDIVNRKYKEDPYKLLYRISKVKDLNQLSMVIDNPFSTLCLENYYNKDIMDLRYIPKKRKLYK
jgi:hypothetical protein